MVDPNDTTLFHDMFDCIHVDKKWFYLAHDRQQFLLANDQIPPQHCVCHKGHITKVMFLCAVVHPHYIVLEGINGGMENSVYGPLVLGNEQNKS